MGRRGVVAAGLAFPGRRCPLRHGDGYISLVSTGDSVPRVSGWEVAYGGGPYAGVDWLEIHEGVLSLRPTRWVGRGSGAPLPPLIEGPIIHLSQSVDVFHARWLPNGSVHLRAAARTYVATLSS